MDAAGAPHPVLVSSLVWGEWHAPLFLCGSWCPTAEADDLDGVAELEHAALHRAGLATLPADGDRRLVEAEPDVVARAAMADGVVLRRLTPAEDAGLERLFFELTTGGASPQSPQIDSVHPELAGATA